MIMMVFALAVGMTACGDKELTEDNTKVEESKESVAEKEESENKEESEVQEAEKEEEIELPNWKGVMAKARGSSAEGDYNITLQYPNSSVRSAYEFNGQWDPVLILVTQPGKDDNGNAMKVENVEDTFSISKDLIIQQMDAERQTNKYTDFDFIVNEQKTMTINDMPCCYYEGMHTYKKEGENAEIPFVAYSFYTGQIENYSYFTIVVVDDYINNTILGELPEGTIQAYARKMVESVTIE